MLTTAPTKRPLQNFDGTAFVGKDILELLTAAMYVDPLTIYREFVQNAADAIDEAEEEGMYRNGTKPRIEIHVDQQNRTARIRDNGAGIPHNWALRRLTALGASKKRGTAARGFRGVGRLAGLAYCQEMLFRTKSVEADSVYELRWDCRRWKELLGQPGADSDLTAVLREIVSITSGAPDSQSPHFFEVELRHVTRQGSDVLLNEDAISRYLSQVGPVPFSPSFRFGRNIQQFLDEFNTGKTYNIYVNGASNPITRPFTTDFEARKGTRNVGADLETFQIPAISDGLDAVGWILHHDYLGAIPDRAGINGLRARVGNLEVGDANIFQNIFPEPRFNSWTVGEVHILSRRIVPNGRRDDFQQNSHHGNLLNHLTPKAKDIARRCRSCSALRAREKLGRATVGATEPSLSPAKVRAFLGANGKKKVPTAERKRLKKFLTTRGLTYDALLAYIADGPPKQKGATRRR